MQQRGYFRIISVRQKRLKRLERGITFARLPVPEQFNRSNQKTPEGVVFSQTNFKSSGNEETIFRLISSVK